MTNPSAVLQPNQLTVPISCAKCGETGSAVVEKTSYPGEYPCEFSLVTLPDTFYQRLAKARPHPIETVCLKCNAVLPPRAYDGEALLAALNAGERSGDAGNMFGTKR